MVPTYLSSNCQGSKTTVSKVINYTKDILSKFSLETTEVNDLIRPVKWVSLENSISLITLVRGKREINNNTKAGPQK